MGFSRAAFVVTLALGVLVGPSDGHAQLQKKLARVGFLAPGSGPGPLFDVFRQGLRELGWVEGQNVAFEPRWAETSDQFPGLAADLARLKVDVIVTTGTSGGVAMKKATPTIPIVFVAVGDPVGAGLVAGLARPGGNVTGLSLLTPELVGKRLELLKEAIPTVSRVAFLKNPANPRAAVISFEVEHAARALGLQVEVFDARHGAELGRAFSAMTRVRADALYALSDPILYTVRDAIVNLAGKNRLPSMFDERGFAEAGGLLSYGTSYADLYRRAAAFVDKVLKGAKPADLPVEQPTKFELVVNLKTAKALGLTIPQSVLVRADHVIR